jgi:hypothetical protein
MVVYCGVDPEFNALRVLPPVEIMYPDLMRDKEEFFEMIGCPHLKEKYYPSEIVNEHAAGGLTDLMELMR